MAEPKKPGVLDGLFNQPLVEPTEGENGIGPTLGEDVSADEERREDRRHGVHSEDQGAGI